MLAKDKMWNEYLIIKSSLVDTITHFKVRVPR